MRIRQAVLESLIAPHHESIDKPTDNGLLTDKGQDPIQAPAQVSKAVSQELSDSIGDKDI
jgi:hypothetical protein